MKKKGGYGMVYQDVLRNPDISIEAKGVYAYLAGYAGTTDECFPSISIMCKELGISKSRLYKHMAFLIDSGVVTKNQTYKGNIKSKVIYHITHAVNESFSVSEKLGIRDFRNPKNQEIKSNILKNNINYQDIADLYNSICVSFPRLNKLSDKRKKTIKARFNQGYTVEDFEQLFKMAEASRFLKGGNARNWSATFDWLISDGNMAKVLDGNYIDRNGGTKDEPQLQQSGCSVKLW